MTIIRRCFNAHVKDCDGAVDFTFDVYARFWVRHQEGSIYKLKNRDGSILECKIAYFPLGSTYEKGQLKHYKDLRALIEIPMANGTDYREVPIIYLKKKY